MHGLEMESSSPMAPLDCARPRLTASIVDSTVAETQQLSVASLFALSSVHTMYTIRSQYHADSAEVQRRFTEFETLHQLLASTWTDAEGEPMLPELADVRVRGGL